MVTKDGLIAEYMEEKLGIETYFTPHGFISYVMREDHIHIHEIFVAKECRREGAGRVLLDYIKDKARENGYKNITCNCQLHHNGADESLKRILNTDFKLVPEVRELAFIMEVT